MLTQVRFLFFLGLRTNQKKTFNNDLQKTETAFLMGAVYWGFLLVAKARTPYGIHSTWNDLFWMKTDPLFFQYLLYWDKHI